MIRWIEASNTDSAAQDVMMSGCNIIHVEEVPGHVNNERNVRRYLPQHISINSKIAQYVCLALLAIGAVLLTVTLVHTTPQPTEQIHGDTLMDRMISRLASRYGESEIAIYEKTVATQKELEEEGIFDNLFTIMEAMQEARRSNEGKYSYSSTLLMYKLLRSTTEDIHIKKRLAETVAE